MSADIHTASSAEAPTSSGLLPALFGAEREKAIRQALATYFVVGPADVQPRGYELLDVVREAIAGGITMLQLRVKGGDARDILGLARAISGVLEERQARAAGQRPLCVIDDRVDVAAAAQREGLHVDGAHVGQSDLPLAHARELLLPGSVCGLSAHTVPTIQAPDVPLADYVGVGAYHHTISKANAGSGLGKQEFAKLVSLCSKPAVAIGGITAADADDVAAAGGAGLCVISAIARADDVQAAARGLAQAWHDAVERLEAQHVEVQQ